MADNDEPMTREDIRKHRWAKGARYILRVAAGDLAESDRLLNEINLTRCWTEEERERAALLLLGTFPGDRAEIVCRIFFEGIGFPGYEVDDNPMAMARFWANDASPQEIRCFAAACIERMTEAQCAKLIPWVMERSSDWALRPIAEAAFGRMSEEDKAAFLKWAGSRDA